MRTAGRAPPPGRRRSQRECPRSWPSVLRPANRSPLYWLASSAITPDLGRLAKGGGGRDNRALREERRMAQHFDAGHAPFDRLSPDEIGMRPRRARHRLFPARARRSSPATRAPDSLFIVIKGASRSATATSSSRCAGRATCSTAGRWSRAEASNAFVAREETLLPSAAARRHAPADQPRTRASPPSSISTLPASSTPPRARRRARASPRSCTRGSATSSMPRRRSSTRRDYDRRGRRADEREVKSYALFVRDGDADRHRDPQPILSTRRSSNRPADRRPRSGRSPAIRSSPSRPTISSRSRSCR